MKHSWWRCFSKWCTYGRMALPWPPLGDFNHEKLVCNLWAISWYTIPHASTRFQQPRTWPRRHASRDGLLSVQHGTLFQVAAEPTAVAVLAQPLLEDFEIEMIYICIYIYMYTYIHIYLDYWIPKRNISWRFLKYQRKSNTNIQKLCKHIELIQNLASDCDF